MQNILEWFFTFSVTYTRRKWKWRHWAMPAHDRTCYMSAYAAVISMLWPHLAARLFQYQQFITLKSKCFQTKAWRRYDSEFRLKLAANKSWHFGEVDTELWASCFAADGLAATTSPNPACFGCGSTSHLHASCPLRRQPARPAANHDLPRLQPPTKGQPAPEERREPCFVYNEKGHCFRGPRSPCPLVSSDLFTSTSPTLPVQVAELKELLENRLLGSIMEEVASVVKKDTKGETLLPLSFLTYD